MYVVYFKDLQSSLIVHPLAYRLIESENTQILYKIENFFLVDKGQMLDILNSFALNQDLQSKWLEIEPQLLEYALKKIRFNLNDISFESHVYDSVIQYLLGQTNQFQLEGV